MEAKALWRQRGRDVRVEIADSNRGTGVISYRMLSIKAAHMELIVVNI